MQEKKPKGIAGVAGLAGTLRTLALVLFVLAVGLNLSGRWLRITMLWTLGGHSATVAIVLGAVVWTLWGSGSRAGRSLWLTALILFGLARFLRGTAAVSPDRPLLGLEVVGLVLAMGSFWRARTKKRLAGFGADD